MIASPVGAGSLEILQCLERHQVGQGAAQRVAADVEHLQLGQCRKRGQGPREAVRVARVAVRLMVIADIEDLQAGQTRQRRKRAAEMIGIDVECLQVRKPGQRGYGPAAGVVEQLKYAASPPESTATGRSAYRCVENCKLVAPTVEQSGQGVVDDAARSRSSAHRRRPRCPSHIGPTGPVPASVVLLRRRCCTTRASARSGTGIAPARARYATSQAP